MANIWSMMDISRTALMAASRQLDVISHNVANVNTDGYSRQEAVQVTQSPEYTGAGYFGRGVKVETVVQHVDLMLEKRLSDKNSDQSYFSTLASMLSRLESLSNEAGEASMGSEITAFFSAWQDVSNNPQSTAVRDVLVQSATNLADRMDSLITDFRAVQRDCNTYLAEGVNQVNELCKDIAELNTQILAGERSGVTANDLRDQRLNKVGELSSLMNIDWYETGNGTFVIQTTGGKTLVQEGWPEADYSGPLEFKEVDGYAFNQVVWCKGDQVMDYEEINSGQMGAWLQTRDVEVPENLAYFDDLAKTMIGEVNKIHSSGVGLNLQTGTITGTYQVSGNTVSFNDNSQTLPFKDLVEDGSFKIWVYDGGTRRDYTISVSANDTLATLTARINSTLGVASDPSAVATTDGRLQFSAQEGIEYAFAEDTSGILAAMGVNTFFDGYSASTISVNSTIASDPDMVAAGRLLADGEHAHGDNSNALDISDLKDTETMNNGTESFNESVINWSSSLGSAVNSAESNLEFAQLSAAELQDLRDAVSGVSLDEEMVKMIQFQRAYQSAAKMISVADEMLVTLIQIKS